MKFEIKMEPVCVVVVVVSCYILIVVIAIFDKEEPYENWYPITLLTYILFLLITYITK